MEEKKRKRPRIRDMLIVLPTVFMLFICTIIPASANGNLILPTTEDGAYLLTCQYAPDSVTLVKQLYPYPDGSEVSLDADLYVNLGKYQTNVISAGEYDTIVNGGNISYSQWSEAEVRNYSEYPFDSNDMVEVGLWTNINAYGNRITVLNDIDQNNLTKIYMREPSINMFYEEIVYNKSFKDNYSKINYTHLDLIHSRNYRVEINGEVSVFNNVTGELNYVPVEINDKIVYSTVREDESAYIRFYPLDYAGELVGKVTSSEYASIRNLSIEIKPVIFGDDAQAYNDNVTSLKTRYTVHYIDDPNIESVWNNQNEAYNWTSFTDWISTSVFGFLNFEIMPNVSIMGIISFMLTASLLVFLLKVFAGG